MIINQFSNGACDNTITLSYPHNTPSSNVQGRNHIRFSYKVMRNHGVSRSLARKVIWSTVFGVHLSSADITFSVTDRA